jgi:hypothetical protein
LILAGISASVSATMPDRMRFAQGTAFSTALDGFRTSAKLFFSFMAAEKLNQLRKTPLKT